MNHQGPGKIGYADFTWNPVTGCYFGCSYCSARRVANRFEPKDYDYANGSILFDEQHQVNLYEADGGPPFPMGFVPTMYWRRLDEPKRLKKPSRIFVSDMGELFGPWVPAEWIEAVLDVARACPRHTFLLLSKNPGRYSEFSLPDNCWPGTTVENQGAAAKRVLALLQVKAAVHWLSYEPALGWLDLTGIRVDKWTTINALEGCGTCAKGITGQMSPNFFTADKVDWVSGGGQTGPGAPPMHPAWMRRVRDDCVAFGTHFFFKGWGGYRPVPFVGSRKEASRIVCIGTDGQPANSYGDGVKMIRIGRKMGRLLDGRTWDEIPKGVA